MYQKTELKGIERPFVKRLADNAFVPMDPQNGDYQQYLAWLAEGNTPLPAETTQPTQEA